MGFEEELAVVIEGLGNAQQKTREKSASRIVDMACTQSQRIAMVKYPGFLDAMTNTLKGGPMSCKEKVAAALGNLALEPRNVVPIATHPELLKALISVFYTDGSDKAKEHVARTLGNIGNGNDEILSAISAAPGAIQAVVDLMHSGTDMAREHAAAIIWDMAQAELINSSVPGLFDGLVGTMLQGSEPASENASGALCTLLLVEPEGCHTCVHIPEVFDAINRLLNEGTKMSRENVAELVWAFVSNGCTEEVATQTTTVGAIVNTMCDNTLENEAAIESCIATTRTLTSSSPQICVLLTEIPGALPGIVALFTFDNDAIQEDAAGTIWNLAYHARIRLQVAKTPGLIQGFLRVTSRDNDEVGPLENVAGAMRMLTAGNDESTQVVANEAEALKVLTDILQKAIDSPMEDTAAAIWNLAGTFQDKMQVCQVPGLVEGLVEVCRYGSDEAKYNAAGALGNLALGTETSEMIARVPGAISSLVNLLSNDLMPCKEHAAAALGNLAMESERNMLLIAKEEGALEGLVNVIKFGDDVAKENAVAALGNLALNTSNMALIAKPGAMAALGTLINTGTQRSQEYAALTLGNLVLNSEDNAQLLLDTPGLLGGLVDLLVTGTDQAKENAALTLSHVAVGSDEPTVLVTFPNCLGNLVMLLHHGTRVAKEDAAAALGNLALRCHDNMDTIGSHPGALEGLVNLLRQEGSVEMIENACLALGNLSLHASNESRIAKIPSCPKALVEVMLSGSDVSKDAAAKVVANLAATNVENKKIFGKEDRLIDTLVSLLQVPASQKSATAALLNLTGVEQNRLVLANVPNAKESLEQIANQNSGPEARHAAIILKKLPGFSASTTATKVQRPRVEGAMGINVAGIAPAAESATTEAKKIVSQTPRKTPRATDSAFRAPVPVDIQTKLRDFNLELEKKGGFKEGTRTDRTARKTARTARGTQRDRPTNVITARDLGETGDE